MSPDEKKDKLSVLNVDEATARAACYIPFLGVIAAVVFLVLEKNRWVRWDAVQAIILWAITVAISWTLGITILLRMLVPVVNVTGMVVIPLVMALKAAQKEDTKLPWLSDMVNKLVK